MLQAKKELRADLKSDLAKEFFQCFIHVVYMFSYTKRTFLELYSYNSFVKFHGKKKVGSHNMTNSYSKPCYNEMCYNGKNVVCLSSFPVDLLAHVFDVLKADLKSDVAKELFLYYQGTTVVLQYLKPVNKVLIILTVI